MSESSWSKPLPIDTLIACRAEHPTAYAVEDHVKGFLYIVDVEGRMVAYWDASAGVLRPGNDPWDVLTT